MSEHKSPFRTTSTISCCRYCVPPKRHTACWDHCPEYLQEKADYEAQKAERRKQEMIRQGLDAQISASVNRAKKGGKKHVK